MSGQGTGKKNVARELAELRGRLAELDTLDSRAESIISAMGDGISIQSPDFKVLYQNQAHRDIVGGDKSGRYCYEAYGGNSSVCEGCALELAFSDGRVHRHERSKTVGETRRHFEIVASPVKNSSGQVIAGIEMVRDVSGLKENVDELEYKSLLLQTTMESSLDGVLVVDEGGRWLTFNSRFIEIWGIPEEIVLSRNDEEAIQFLLDKVVDPDGFVVQLYQIYEDTGAKRAQEVKLLDGRTIERYTSPMTSKAGEYLGRVWYFRDITMRTKAQEQLAQYREQLEDIVEERTAKLTTAVGLLKEQIADRRRSEQFTTNILESIDEWLMVLGPDYRVISANKAFCDHMGMSMEGLKGKHCYELLHKVNVPCHEAGVDCSMRRAFDTGEPSTAAHVHDHDGEPHDVETKSYPMRDAAGNVVSVIQIIHDVTERRKLEDQLRHSQKMEAIGQLAGGVAHDFNNRLAAIMNYAFILKTKMGHDDPLRVFVNQIINSSERAAHLTQNLLTFSRKQIINPRPVNINEIVSGVEKLLARVIGEEIELKTEYSDEDLVVMADSGQIEHVLINLATNSRDAIPGTGRVAISTSRVALGTEFFEGRARSRPGPYALISFMDSGVGMDDVMRSKVFEPFFTTKDINKGTGLGLSIVYGVIKQHEGYISVESEPGVGTAVYIFLPLLPVRAEKEVAKSTIAPAGGGEIVLLVEDDEGVRTPMRQMLEGFGYEVMEATTGEEAVEIFMGSRRRIGLLMLDVILPGMSGPVVLKNIQEVYPDIKAIFTSGHTREHIDRKGLLAPDSTLLTKPVAPQELLRKVREKLDG